MERRKMKRKTHLIKVTTTSFYSFEDGSINGWKPAEVLEDWFESYPIDSHHATRDTHRISGATIVDKVELISEGQWAEETKKINEQNLKIISKKKAEEKQRAAMYRMAER
jgi:hypothetical protein